ncbi:MAG TPA: hypothetical protein VIO15_01645, partial [Bacteroidales bacterium]
RAAQYNFDNGLGAVNFTALQSIQATSVSSNAAAGGGGYGAYGPANDPGSVLSAGNSGGSMYGDVWSLPEYGKGNDPRYPGINIYRDATRGYTLPWEGIHVPENASEAYIQHEYGHYLQYRKWGPEYYAKVMAKSGWSAVFDTDYQHMRIPVELEATTMAHDFFGPNSYLNNNNWPTYYNLQINK